ncbi:hypothetical protein AB0A05_15535 [Streptomyces sp. NPDC046374]|uniref:hypothetical protein n=1 Tax=Streptomyces sp. NPDC046374 TaxID=3154917 RepID=UPI0033E9A0FA
MSSSPSGTGTGSSGPSGTDSTGRRQIRLTELAALISAGAAVAGVALGFLGLPTVLNSPTARTGTQTVYVTPSPSPPGQPAATAGSSSAAPSPSTKTPLPNAVTIEKPTDGPIPRCIDISGQGQAAQGHQLWIGMRVDKEFFILRPVSQDSTAGAGRWSAKAVTVGSEEGTGADYIIAVLDVTPDLSTTLTRLTVDGQPDNLWRIAFPSYPAGTVIKVEKPLHRNATEQASC